MVLGPRLGTLVGTLRPTPMCALQAHVVLSLLAVKYLVWDDAKNAKLRKESGTGFEDIVFHMERGDPLDILEHPHPDRQRIFVVQREEYVYLVPFPPSPASWRRGLRGGAHGLPENDLPSRKATKQYLGEESDDHEN